VFADLISHVWTAWMFGGIVVVLLIWVMRDPRIIRRRG
jgi:hypothetical protein